MKNLVPFVVILGITVLAYFLFQYKREQPVLVETALPDLKEERTIPEPAPVKFPVPAPVVSEMSADTPAATPLPELDQSDGPVRDSLSSLYDAALLDRLFSFESIIRYFVVTVDNMTAAKLPQKFRFTLMPADKFIVKADTDGSFLIDPTNNIRYAPYVRFIEVIDLDMAVELYFRYYPLFQQAYAELGYPDRYFNDRFIEVIDHLLAAPLVTDPIPLKQPKVYYTFADPKLEALSAGQKLILRIGHDNANRVKIRLQQLRRALTAQH